jgi:hypothetical protein
VSRQNITVVVMAGVVALAVGLAAGLLINRAGRPAADDAAMARVLARLDALEAGGPAAAPRSQAFADPQARQLAAFQAGLTSGKPVPAARGQTVAPQERIRALDARFVQDASDAGAAKVELDMLKAMAEGQMVSTGLVAGNPDVECRRHGCRITADFRGQDEAMEWALDFVTMVGQGAVNNAQPVVVANPDGSARLRLYASRSGS